MNDDSQERSQQLERSLLDLGLEVYHLKDELGNLRKIQQLNIHILEALKVLLDEKNLVTYDEFEVMVDLAREQANEYNSAVEELKKNIN